MKKLPVLLGLVLVLSLLLSPVAFASGGNYDTLADWDLRIAVPDNAASAVLKGNTYYIYAQNDGYIPYVMLMATSQFDSEEDFIDHLTDSLAEQYQRQGFKVTASPELKPTMPDTPVISAFDLEFMIISELIPYLHYFYIIL